MTERDKRVWKRFIHLLSVASFGEKEVIMEGKVQKNLYGSVESHRKTFEEAIQQIDSEVANG